MVFVKVRETYDLHTVKNRMTVIGIHTPKPDIIQKNFPGLLMQCRSYRPVSADVRIACASMLPLDPKGVGVAEGDVAPEDVFNPILYKAMSNKGMSQLEARINYDGNGGSALLDVAGNSAEVDVDTTTAATDEFPIYYGLLSNAHDWKHANPQAGLQMSGLKPLVYEMVYNIGDSISDISVPGQTTAPNTDGTPVYIGSRAILGNAKPFPFIPCTAYAAADACPPGFVSGNSGDNIPYNKETTVPYMKVFCGCIVIPPSRLHELFYRMVVEWTIEFSTIRPIGEITDWLGLATLGSGTHYQNYSYEQTKAAITGDPESSLKSDSCMVAANVNVNKVM